MKKGIVDKYLLSVGVILSTFHSVTFFKLVVQPGRLPLRPDSAIFQYAGWYMLHGGTLYTEIWEVKLPLAYEIPALLAVLSGGNILLHHLLNIVLTMIAAIVSGLLVAHLVADITDDQEAAILSGISVLLLPGFFYLPAFGFKAKFFVTLTVLTSIYLARMEYPTLSGAFAAACVGFYHAAAVVPFLAVGLNYQYNQLRGAAKAVAGGVILTGIMITPIVLAGATEAMITETILIPFIIDSGGVNPILRILRGGFHFGVAAPAVLLGGGGLLLSITKYKWRDIWWVIVAAGWFAFIVFFVDYDSYPDLIPGVVIVAIGVGLVYDQSNSTLKKSLIASIICISIILNLILILSIGWVGGIYSFEGAQPLSELENTTYQISDEEQVDRPDVRYLYWNQIEPNTCHVRLSGTEIQWLRLTNKPLTDQRCGDLRTALRYI